MSKFKRAVPILAALTKAPLFVRMWQEQRAFPMQRGIDKLIVAGVPEEHRKTAKREIGRLARSARYLDSLIEPGAQRHSLDGDPVEPVSALHRDVARIKREAMRQIGRRGSSATVQVTA